MSEFKFIEGRDYYLEKGRLIMTEEYLTKRGPCCGSGDGCRHCPFEPQHTKGTTNLKKNQKHGK